MGIGCSEFVVAVGVSSRIPGPTSWGGFVAGPAAYLGNTTCGKAVNLPCPPPTP